jgi:hypothetical protein
LEPQGILKVPKAQPENHAEKNRKSVLQNNRFGSITGKFEARVDSGLHHQKQNNQRYSPEQNLEFWGQEDQIPLSCNNDTPKVKKRQLIPGKLKIHKMDSTDRQPKDPMINAIQNSLRGALPQQTSLLINPKSPNYPACELYDQVRMENQRLASEPRNTTPAKGETTGIFSSFKPINSKAQTGTNFFQSSTKASKNQHPRRSQGDNWKNNRNVDYHESPNKNSTFSDEIFDGQPYWGQGNILGQDFQMKNRNSNPKLNESDECIFKRFLQTDSIQGHNPKKHFELAQKVYKTITTSGWKKSTQELESDNAKLNTAHNFYLNQLSHPQDPDPNPNPSPNPPIDLNSRLQSLSIKPPKKTKVIGLDKFNDFRDMHLRN